MLAIPAILGATVLQLKDITSVSQLLTMPNLFGFLSAGVSGFFALKMLDLVIHKAKLHYFGYYCIVLSLGIMIYLVQ